MPRINDATQELEILDEDHLLLVGYKDDSAQDKKMQPINLAKSLLYINDIINGNMDIWQRQVSFAAIASGVYHTDRFGYEKSGAMIHTITRDTDTPNDNFNFSIKSDITTADASIAAGDFCLPVEQVIEGYNFKKYSGNYGTLSFWARDTKTGIHCVSFRNSGKDRSYVAEYTINVADTWEYKTIVIPFDETTGTWNYINGAGLRISWCLAAGSTFQTTKDAWQTGNFFATASQVNGCDNTANNFYITGIVFNYGKVPIADNNIDFAYEMVRCQRYSEKSYNQDVFAGTITQEGALISGQAGASTFLKLQKALASKKRVPPTVLWYSTKTGAVNNVYLNVGATDQAVSSTGFAGEYSSGIPIATASVADGEVISTHYTIDAEIAL